MITFYTIKQMIKLKEKKSNETELVLYMRSKHVAVDAEQRFVAGRIWDRSTIERPGAPMRAGPEHAAESRQETRTKQ